MKKPATTKTLAPVSECKAAGVELTAQYRRAVSGMKEVLIFGAMLMKIEHTLSNVDKVSARGRPVDGNGLKGEGLKGWLEANAPEISRPTALRFLGVTKAVAAEYQAIVGVRVAKQFDLPALVLTKAGDLPEAAQAKQLELFDYVAGTSQRSWLDAWREPTPPVIGGDTRERDEQGNPINRGRATKAEIERRQFEDLGTIRSSHALRSIESLLAVEGPKKERGWWVLPPDELTKLKLAAYDLYNGILECESRRAEAK